MSHEHTDEPGDTTVLAWLAVGLFFVVGDAVTTYTGFFVGAYEANPVADAMLTQAGVVGMAVGKVAAVGVAAVFYRRAQAYPWAVPAALGVMGILIVAWNLAVITVLLVG